MFENDEKRARSIDIFDIEGTLNWIKGNNYQKVARYLSLVIAM